MCSSDLHLARRSPAVNQRSGVSVRLTIANFESVVANALRRALRQHESEVVPRITDLGAAVASTQGKIEIEAMEEGIGEEIFAGEGEIGDGVGDVEVGGFWGPGDGLDEGGTEDGIDVLPLGGFLAALEERSLW